MNNIEDLENCKLDLENEVFNLQYQINLLYDKLNEKSDQIVEIEEQINSIKFKDIIFVPNVCYYAKNPTPGYHDWEEVLYLVKEINIENPDYITIIEFEKRCSDDDKFIRIEKGVYKSTTFRSMLGMKEIVKISEEEKEKYLKMFTYLD